ncbi:MAG: hypothetical protein IJA60_08520 [Clostridia bacterium]|nr:hypothetical protein [Clostridia bacterium]
MNLYIPPYGKIQKKDLTILLIIAIIMIAPCAGLFIYCTIDAVIQKDIFYFFISLFGIFVCIVAPTFFYLMGKNNGLYIEDGKICYKNFRKKHYNVEDFAGLLILKSQFKPRYSSPEYIKNKQGEYEYSIVYLNDTRPEFENYENGALDFTTYWARYVHFYTKYDERVIEYFESNNIPILNKEQAL